MRVLIVDDFAINRRLLEAQLDRWKLPHESAASATEAPDEEDAMSPLTKAMDEEADKSGVTEVEPTNQEGDE